MSNQTRFPRGSTIILLAWLLASAGSACAQSLSCGDCNGDGRTDILDSLAASQSVVGSGSIGSPEFEACNVRAPLGGPAAPGAIIDVVDALAIAQLSAGVPVTVDCASQPECTITAPRGGMFAGAVSIVFDLADLDGDDSTCAFDYSLDAGATWVAASPVMGSPLANPAPGVAPGMGLAFVWDSFADLGATSTAVALRVSCVDRVSLRAECTTQTTIIIGAPSCAISAPAPAATVSAGALITFDATSTGVLTAAFDISTDAGVSFQTAADAGGGLLTGNPTAPFTAGVGLTWEWQSAVDIPGVAPAVLRITLTDTATGLYSGCLQGLVADNNDSPSCLAAPAIAPGASGGPIVVDFTTRDPEADPLDVLVEFSTDGVTFESASLGGCGGSMLSNPAFAQPTGATSFCWASGRDIPGHSATVTLRATLDDGAGGVTTGCQAMGLTVDNRPGCSINSPAPGTVLTSSDLISYTATDPDGDLLSVSFQFSSDSGVSFLPALPRAGTSPRFVMPSTDDFAWDIGADLPAGGIGVILRVLTFDGTSLTSCDRTFDVVEQFSPACAIISPIAPAPQLLRDDVEFLFDVTDANPADLQSVTWEFSIDGGVSWQLMSAAGASLLPNPAAGVTPAAGLSFVWDKPVDLPCSLGSGTAYAVMSHLPAGGTSVIDVATRTVVASAPTPTSCTEVAVHPSGAFVYVSNGDDIFVIDTSSSTIVDTIDDANSMFNKMAVDPGGAFLYAAGSDASFPPVNMLFKVDLATKAVVAAVASDGIDSLVLDPAGTLLYAASRAGAILALDPVTLAVVATVPVALGFGIEEMVVHPAGTPLYAAVRGDGMHVIDLTTHTLVTTIPLPSLGEVSIHPSGNFIYTGRDQDVYAVDTTTGMIDAVTTLGGAFAVDSISIHPSGSHLYVANSYGGPLMFLSYVTVVDTATFAQEPNIPIPHRAGVRGDFVASGPMPPAPLFEVRLTVSDGTVASATTCTGGSFLMACPDR